jgi:hypothetical protein
VESTPLPRKSETSQVVLGTCLSVLITIMSWVVNFLPTLAGSIGILVLLQIGALIWSWRTGRKAIFKGLLIGLALHLLLLLAFAGLVFYLTK